MKVQDKYNITSVAKKLTEHGNNYFEISAVEVATGVIVECVYFGNTTPKRLLDIVEHKNIKNDTVYYIGIIQPHTSRDKKTGRFIKGKYRTD